MLFLIVMFILLRIHTQGSIIVSISQDTTYLNLGDVQFLHRGQRIDPALLTFNLSSFYHPDLDAIRCNNGDITDFCCTGDEDTTPSLIINTNQVIFDEIVVYNRLLGKHRDRINGAVISIFNDSERILFGSFENSSSFKYIFRFYTCHTTADAACLGDINNFTSARMEFINYPSVSQVGQDEWVIDYFQEKKNGVFVEIGANDGITFSNSYVLEKYYNWTGIVIEAIPDMHTSLQRHRNCTILSVCASNFTGFTTFEMLTDMPAYFEENGFNINLMSGVSATWRWQYAPDSIQQYHKTINVMCINIQDIFDHFRLAMIDYFSVDCEGCELSVISAIKWDRMTIRVLHVEMGDESDQQILDIMASIGYRQASIGHDWLFVLP